MSADIPQNVPLVLVADDDMAGRLLVRESLEQAGLRVVEAENGLEAVARFREFQPQLVLLDVMMPEMDGYAACAALRKLPGGQAVPILMLTGLEDVESINRAYEVGATDFATKPINWLVLRHRVRYMLRAGQVLDELHRSEARLTAAQRTARLGSWEWDLVSGRGHWSAQVYHLLGYEPGEFWPDYRKFIERVHPEDRGALDAVVAAALPTPSTIALRCRTARHAICMCRGSRTAMRPAGRCCCSVPFRMSPNASRPKSAFARSLIMTASRICRTGSCTTSS